MLVSYTPKETSDLIHYKDAIMTFVYHSSLYQQHVVVAVQCHLLLWQCLFPRMFGESSNVDLLLSPGVHIVFS